MKIESLVIDNIGGISNLSLDNFNPNLNIICGENGIGKTNILECISNSFSFFQNHTLTIKQGKTSGNIKFLLDGTVYEKTIKMKKVTNDICMDRDRFELFNNDQEKHMFYIKTSRVFNYQRLTSISIDPTRKHRMENQDGIKNNELKNFFVLRSFYARDTDCGISEIELHNFEVVKSAISLLDNRFVYKNATMDNEIVIQTPTGNIFLEMLSSGFQSIVYVVIGIIQEIEYRFKDKPIKAGEFDGIILIDEIELHLHPEWQGKICPLLTKVFPNAQFIVTTHSPHVVQSAEADQVIALSGQDGYLEKRTLDIAPHGFKGWTIEEILTDVMGMTDTRTNLYRDIKKKFDDALDSKDLAQAKIAYQQLDELLHPSYPLRPLFKMQLDGLED